MRRLFLISLAFALSAGFGPWIFSRADPDARVAPSSGFAGCFSLGLAYSSSKSGAYGCWLSSLCVVLAVCIFYDFFGLRTQRKVLSVSKLREDPDFGASSASSAVKI
jgi:hypothetical protein